MKTGALIVASLAIVVGFCGAMLLMTLLALGELDRAEIEVAALDQAKHAAHMVEAHLREQYIHQAHSIIERDDSHLDHYREVAQKTRNAIKSLSQLAQDPNDRGRASQLAALAQKNDRQFREQVVPALRGSPANLVKLHREIEPVIKRVTQVNAELSHILNGRSARARADANVLRRHTRTMAILCFGSALVVAVLVGGFLSRRIGGRVSTLRRGAQRIAAGETGVRVELKGRDEFAELARTFNSMSTNLASHQAGLLRAQRLASIGQVAAGVAHEINNPLAVILGYTNMLRDKVDGKTASKVSIIEDEARQCQRIVDDLLTLARPQELHSKRFDLVAMCRSEIDRLSEGGRLLDAQIDLRCAHETIDIVADEGRLRQVFGNLLVNAAEANPAGKIAIDVSQRSGETKLTVSDEGPGMSAEQLARATEPFFTTKAHGVGMGLSICQAIVESHGGEMELSSTDNGVAISVTLPVGGVA